MKVIAKFWQQQTAFLEDCCKAEPQEFYQRKFQDNYGYWLPVIAGIATCQEVELMTREELEEYIQAAQMKIKLFGKGGGVDE